MDCAKLSEKEISILSTNYIWLCDECLERFQSARDKRASRESTIFDSSHGAVNNDANRKSMEDDIAELKNTVAEIVETLAKYAPTHSTTDPPVMHSTPISPHTLQDGKNVCSFNVSDDGESQQQCVMEDGNFSLLLTNIDARVAEHDVHRLVVQALGSGRIRPENIVVVKLVSQWMSHRAMDYASFKVVIHKRWKEKAMNPLTWPKGIKFREFINRQIETWKPMC